MPIKYHICELLQVQISDNYVSKCTSFELIAINNMTMATGIHKFNIIAICTASDQIYLPHTFPTALIL